MSPQRRSHARTRYRHSTAPPHDRSSSPPSACSNTRYRDSRHPRKPPPGGSRIALRLRIPHCNTHRPSNSGWNSHSTTLRHSRCRSNRPHRNTPPPHLDSNPIHIGTYRTGSSNHSSHRAPAHLDTCAAWGWALGAGRHLRLPPDVQRLKRRQSQANLSATSGVIHLGQVTGRAHRTDRHPSHDSADENGENKGFPNHHSERSIAQHPPLEGFSGPTPVNPPCPHFRSSTLQICSIRYWSPASHYLHPSTFACCLLPIARH